MYDVTAYGATGDGQTDDRAAIQSAIDACVSAGGGVVYFPAGTYALVKQGTTIPLLLLDGADNVVFRGDGVGNTTLLRAAGTHNNDTHIVQVKSGSRLSFEGLTFDGNRQNCTDSDAQRHGLYLGGLNGAVSDVRVVDCEFINTRGDGIYVIGDVSNDPSYTASRLWVQRCSFYDSQRSGIACQRGLSWFWFTDNSFETITDQSIDTEASGSAGAISYGWIERNRIKHDNYTGALALSVGGVDANTRSTHIGVASNIIDGGSARVIYADHVDWRDNTVIGGTTTRALEIRDSSHVRMTGGYVEGNAPNAGAEAALLIQGVNGTTEQVRVRHMTVAQTQTTSGLEIVKAWNTGAGVTVEDCTLTGSGGTQYKLWRATA